MIDKHSIISEAIVILPEAFFRVFLSQPGKFKKDYFVTLYGPVMQTASAEL